MGTAAVNALGIEGTEGTPCTPNSKPGKFCLKISGLCTLQARIVYISIRGAIVPDAAIEVNGITPINLNAYNSVSFKKIASILWSYHQGEGLFHQGNLELAIPSSSVSSSLVFEPASVSAEP